MDNDAIDPDPDSELGRLRQLETLVKRILSQVNDDHCWMDWGRLYPEMAGLVGMPDWTAKVLHPAVMRENCHHFIDCLMSGNFYIAPSAAPADAAIGRAAARIRKFYRDTRRVNEAWSAMESSAEIEANNPDAAAWVRAKAAAGLRYNEADTLDLIVGDILAAELAGG